MGDSNGWIVCLQATVIGSPVFSAPGILVIPGCRTDLIGAASTVASSLTGLILEIRMKPGEIDLCFKALHL